MYKIGIHVEVKLEQSLRASEKTDAQRLDDKKG